MCNHIQVLFNMGIELHFCSFQSFRSSNKRFLPLQIKVSLEPRTIKIPHPQNPKLKPYRTIILLPKKKKKPQIFLKSIPKTMPQPQLA